MMETMQPFLACRGRLLGLAYRMLGSRADAEDVLQDAFVRFSGVDRATIGNPEAYLVTIVTRLCLDQLRSAKARREVYVGPWLPEPVPDAETMSAESALELADDLSFALLLTLETLTPSERAAFLLHDVFDVPFFRVAEILSRGEAACRQLAARARRAVREGRPKRSADPDQHAALLRRFVETLASGDAAGLEGLLAADARLYSDGGGRKHAALRPILGASKVQRFLTGVHRKTVERGGEIEIRTASLNGAMSLLIYLDGVFDQTLSIQVCDGRIAAIYLVRNPEKLDGLSRTL